MAKKIEVPEINWELITPELIKAFTPFIQALTWLGLTRVDPKVNALNNLIAIAEVVPTVDLNLPRGIVLAALYDKTADSLKMMSDLLEILEDIPENLKKLIKEMITEAETGIIEEVPLGEELITFTNALSDCDANAKKTLPGWAYGTFYIRLAWVQSCMGQKGLSVSRKWIESKLK